MLLQELKTAKETLNSEYFKDVHGYIAGDFADMQVMFFETNKWRPSEWGNKASTLK